MKYLEGFATTSMRLSLPEGKRPRPKKKKKKISHVHVAGEGSGTLIVSLLLTIGFWREDAIGDETKRRNPGKSCWHSGRRQGSENCKVQKPLGEESEQGEDAPNELTSAQLRIPGMHGSWLAGRATGR